LKSINSFMQLFQSYPFFGFLLCLLPYAVCVFLKKKIKSTLFNPILLSTIFVIAVLLLFEIPYKKFYSSALIMIVFLPIATIAFGFVVYRQFDYVYVNKLAIIGGCFAGALTSVASSFMLAKYIFNLPMPLTIAVLPKSATTPIAIDVLGSIKIVVILWAWGRVSWGGGGL
jgi:putative effector of murein hydrolase